MGQWSVKNYIFTAMKWPTRIETGNQNVASNFARKTFAPSYCKHAPAYSHRTTKRIAAIMAEVTISPSMPGENTKHSPVQEGAAPAMGQHGSDPAPTSAGNACACVK